MIEGWRLMLFHLQEDWNCLAVAIALKTKDHQWREILLLLRVLYLTLICSTTTRLENCLTEGFVKTDCTELRPAMTCHTVLLRCVESFIICMKMKAVSYLLWLRCEEMLCILAVIWECVRTWVCCLREDCFNRCFLSEISIHLSRRARAEGRHLIFWKLGFDWAIVMLKRFQFNGCSACRLIFWFHCLCINLLIEVVICWCKSFECRWQNTVGEDSRLHNTAWR